MKNLIRGNKVAKEAKKEEVLENKVPVDQIPGCVIIYKKVKLSVDSVRVGVGATISTGQFETARFDYSMTLRPIEPNTELADIAEIGWDICKDEVAKQITATRTKVKGKQ